ncbi:MAG: hypothetical protein QXP73_06525 [Candidatus Methanomethylicaceae archaeon]|nr:hypothetical protein [Candidatus Verstraetearchaeota archaeon]
MIQHRILELPGVVVVEPRLFPLRERIPQVLQRRAERASPEMLSSKGDPPQQIASLAPWGSIKICGYNIPEQRSELIKITGYMAQRFSLYEDLSVFENLEFFGKFYGINGKELKIRILELLEFLDLKDAKEFLRLVGEGRVPMEAVSEQKNALLRNTVRVLRRYFMVVGHMDGTGTKWYRLTKVGEKALREMEGGEG